MIFATALLGCGRSQATWIVAVGAGEELSRIYGPCPHGPTAGPLRFTSGDHYEAMTPGHVRLECRDGVVVVDVRPVHRLAITPVADAAVGARPVYSIVAYDARGTELLVGRDGAVVWTFSGALSARARPGCGDILPICPAASNGYASADTPGIGVVMATFGALRASTTTTVR